MADPKPPENMVETSTLERSSVQKALSAIQAEITAKKNSRRFGGLIENYLIPQLPLLRDEITHQQIENRLGQKDHALVEIRREVLKNLGFIDPATDALLPPDRTTDPAKKQTVLFRQSSKDPQVFLVWKIDQRGVREGIYFVVTPERAASYLR